jgi:hypothetical protein
VNRQKFPRGIGLCTAVVAIALFMLIGRSDSSSRPVPGPAPKAPEESTEEGGRFTDALPPNHTSLNDLIRSRPTFRDVHPETDDNPSVEVGRTISIVPNTSVVPGQLISGKDLNQGTFREVILPRGVATISVDLPNEGGSVRTDRELPQWTRASAITAIRDVWNNAPLKTTTLHARYLAERAHNQREARHLVNASGTVLGNLFEGGFATESAYYEEGTVFVALLEQIQYTASHHSLQSPADYFADRVTSADFVKAFGEEDCPCIISDVHYGRYFAVAIRSSAMRSSEVQEIHAGLNLMFAGSSAKVSDQQRQLIDKCVVRAVALGGPPAAALRAMTGRDIEKYLEEGAVGGADGPAVPIAYTVKNLKDNSIVEIVRQIPAQRPPQRVRATITGFKLLQAHDYDDEEDIDVAISANGHDLYNMTNKNHYIFGNDPGHDVYAIGRYVDIGPTNEVIIAARVRSRDYHEPDYGEKDVVVRIPLHNGQAREGFIEHELNKGHWKVEYRIEHIE